MVYTPFHRELQNDPVDIPRAMLCLAQAIAYPDLDISNYMKKLEHLADIAQMVISPHAPIAYQAQALLDFLNHQEGFRGNTAAYHDPRNSYLNELLDRQLGIPISLSILYITLAQRLNLPAEGVGLPGHFIVTIVEKEHSLFFDPFYGGTSLSRLDCVRLVRRSTGYRGPFNVNWLTPIPPHDILVRLLNNLRLIYTQRARWKQAIIATQHLRFIKPNEHDYIRDLSLLYYQSGSLPRSAQYMEMYLERSPDSPDAKVIRENAEVILSRWAKLN